MSTQDNKKKKPGHARKTTMPTVKVKITDEKGLGQYKKGAIVEMHKTTAEGVINSGKAEKSGNW